MINRNKKSITLIELIVVIVVLGVGISSLMGMFVEANFNTLDTQALVDSTFYAEELMEQIRSKQFEDPDQTPVFGPESGESTADDYDDIDDYESYSDTIAVYNRWVDVEYVELDVADSWQSAGSPPTDYKKITIEVKRGYDSATFASLVLVMSDS